MVPLRMQRGRKYKVMRKPGIEPGAFGLKLNELHTSLRTTSTCDCFSSDAAGLGVVV